MMDYRVFLLVIYLMLLPAAAGAQNAATATAPVAEKTLFQKVEEKFDTFFDRVFKRDHGDDVDPTATLVAPFADTSVVKPLAKGERYKALIESNKISLDKPHRSDKDLAAWVMEAVTYSLGFNRDNFESRMNEISTGFTPVALGQYKAWVESSGILQSIQQDNLEMASFTNQMPLVVNQGLVGTSYRWLFDVPVSISFAQRGAAGAAAIPVASPPQDVIVSIQLGRASDSILEHGVRIESWSVRIRDVTKK